MNEIFVRDLMSKGVKSATTDTPLENIIQLMDQHALSCIVILENNTPVGIITERDLVGILAKSLQQPLDTSLPASQIMSKPPICLSADSTLYEALVVTQTRKIRHVPIIDDNNQLTGIITQTNIALAHFMAIETQRKVIEQQLGLTQELVEANEELKALALQDGLLDIGNRRAMEVDLQFTHSNAVRYQHAYTIALLDVDYFKSFNDCYGHPEGDRALKAVVGAIKKNVRASDRLYRYGGEEFLILMPNTRLPEAINISQRVLKGIADLAIENRDSPFKVITVSAGLATIDLTQPVQWQQILTAADQCLYAAKNGGRNQVHWVGLDDGVKKMATVDG